MIVEGLAIGGLTPETVLALHGRGGMGLGAIERHQPLVMKPPKVAQQAVWLKALKNLKQHPSEQTRPHGVEQVAYLIVAGHRLQAKQDAGIIASLGFLEMALVIQK
jgi:hypothetical protein